MKCEKCHIDPQRYALLEALVPRAQAVIDKYPQVRHAETFMELKLALEALRPPPARKSAAKFSFEDAIATEMFEFR